MNKLLNSHPPPPAGLPSEGRPDALGQSHHGHSGVSCSGHRAAHRVSAATQAVRPQQASHLQDHDEEHPGSRCVPARHHFHPALRW